MQRTRGRTLAERLAGWQERYPDVHGAAVSSPSTGRRTSCSKQSESAQLMVVGSHGRGGFAGMLLGSVAPRSRSRRACVLVVVDLSILSG